MLKKRIILGLVVAFMAIIGFSGLAQGIVFDSASSGQNGSEGDTLTFSHTIGSGSNRILVVGTGVEDGTPANMEIAGVTYNGVAMQPVAFSSATAGTSFFQKTDLYYLLDNELPSQGTYSVVVTYLGTVDDRSGGAISLVNVAQQPAESVDTKTNTSSNTISTDLSTFTDGAWVVDVVGCGHSGSFTATENGQEERYDVSPDSSTAAGSTRHVPTAGEVEMSWTFPGANRLAHSVAAFAPDGSGDGGDGDDGTAGDCTDCPDAWDKQLTTDRFELVMPTTANPDGEGVLDHETCLVWEQSPDTTVRPWTSALSHCFTKIVGDRLGWRAPTIAELTTLIDRTQPAPKIPAALKTLTSNVQSSFYWSSTTAADNTASAWLVRFSGGGVSGITKGFGSFVWCVRGGQGHDAY